MNRNGVNFILSFLSSLHPQIFPNFTFRLLCCQSTPRRRIYICPGRFGIFGISPLQCNHVLLLIFYPCGYDKGRHSLHICWRRQSWRGWRPSTIKGWISKVRVPACPTLNKSATLPTALALVENSLLNNSGGDGGGSYSRRVLYSIW